MPKGISRRDFLRTTARAGVAAGLAGTSFLKASPQGTYDLVIRNARVCDGTGAEAVPSDIGIRGERIAHIGSLNGARARRILDAEGHVASPGFIDIHTHSDLELLVNPRGESKIHQGVTTELTGNCGSSAFPIRLPLSDEEKAMAERLNLKIEWTDLSGYHAALSRKGTAVNLGTLIGNGTLRHVVVGDVDREPSDAEMEEMKTHVARAMEQGAFGLSTGLEYTPSGFASTDEVIALCRVVARYGGFYATHMRSEDKSVIEAVAEAIHIAEAAGLPLQISHFKAVGRPNWWKLPMMI
ncbi:MAG: amidohydrolase family protein, partial [Candidatus Aminicenantales bacterium]